MKKLPRLPRPNSPLVAIALVLVAALAFACSDDGDDGGSRVERVYGAQGNQLDVYELASNVADTLIQSAGDGGNDVNGQVCLMPDGSGNFMMGEDTDQSEGARQGWGIFSPDGELVDKILLPEADVEAEQPEPFGCAFDGEDRLFVTDVGSGSFDAQDGKLVVFFPPDYDTLCVLDASLSVPGTVAIDDDGRVYVPETVPPGHVLRFSPPFPANADECENMELNRESFVEDPDMTTPFGIAPAANGNWYVSSVVLPPTIREYDAGGAFVRVIVEGDGIGNPAGLAVAADGTIFYADLGLVPDPDRGFAPGDRTGTVRRVSFDDAGEPLPPETIGEGLAYPDAVSVLEVDE